MRILIERFRYRGSCAREALGALAAFEGADGGFEVSLVGYFYNASIADFVFILPKVVLADAADGGMLVLGVYDPEVLAASDGWRALKNTHWEFISSLAVWTYRAISVYKSESRGDTAMVLQPRATFAESEKSLKSATLLDTLLALRQFGRDNRDYYLTVAKNLQGGFCRVNWLRTVGRQSPVVQAGTPIYPEPVTKRSVVDFDEELLVIFYSILKYVGEKYGFAEPPRLGFPLIVGAHFDAYLGGLGKTRLLRIRHNYFSDKSLRLWHLCYAFFDAFHRLSVEAEGGLNTCSRAASMLFSRLSSISLLATTLCPTA